MAFREVRQPIVLQPQSRLDVEGGIVLQQQIAAIASETSDLWTIDMSNVEFIDSSGLVALVKGLNIAEQYQCRLVLCNLRAAVRLIFEITQLDQVFDIVEGNDLPLTVQTFEHKSIVEPGLVAA